MIKGNDCLRSNISFRTFYHAQVPIFCKQGNLCFLNILLVKSVLSIKSPIKAINMKGADFFKKKVIRLVRSGTLTSTGIECPWCGIENAISGA